jgi:hypothetical protein
VAAELSLKFGAQEDVSTAAKAAGDAVGKLGKDLGDTGQKAKGAADDLDKTTKSSLDLGKAVIVLNQGLELAKKGFELLAVPVEKATEYLKRGAELMAKQEQGIAALRAVVGPAADGISKLADEIERKTGADADALRSTGAWLGSLGLTSREIERALPGLQAYADVTGKDLTAGVRRLQGALEQGKLDEEIRGLEQFMASAEAQAHTFGGELRRLDAELENLQKGVGESVTQSGALQQTLEAVIGFVETLTEDAKHLGPAMGDVLADGIALAAEAGGIFLTVLQGMAAGISGFLQQVNALNVGAGRVAEFFGGDASSYNKAAAQGEASIARWDQLGVAIARVNERVEDLKKNVGSEGVIRMPGLDFSDRKGGGGSFRNRKVSRDDKPSQIGDTTIYDIPEMDLEDKGRAQVRAFGKGWRDEEEKHHKEAMQLAKESAEKEAQAAQEAMKSKLAEEKEFKQAGIKAGLGYLDALGSAIRGDGKGALKSAIGAIASVIGLAIGGPLGGQIGGSVSSFIGGFLRDGGPLGSIELPKARQGIAFVDMDADGMLFEGHRGEVMLNAQGVAKNGGIDRVSRQNNPLEPPMDDGWYGGGGTSTVYVSALSPTDAAAAVRQTIEPGMIANLDNHRSGLLERQIRESARYPRSE